MLTTTRRDQRTRRQALFTLETLDDRMVLSAAAAGAAAEAAGAASSHAAIVAQPHEAQVAQHDAKLARMQARHEAKEARIDARHAARLAARAATAPTLSASVAIPLTPTASAATASTTTASTASTTAPGGTSATFTTSPAASVSAATPTPTPSSTSTSSPGPLPANVAAPLQALYTEYVQAGTSFTPSQPSDKLLQISGDDVEVSLKIASSADFDTALSQLQSDGMQVNNSSASYLLIDGMLPISELPAAAQIASSVNAVPPPQF